MRVIAYQLRKETTVSTFLIRVGNTFYEMDAFAMQPNGVCMYAGDVSSYHWDWIKSKFRTVKLNDLPDQTLWAIIQRMIDDFRSVANIAHSMFNEGDCPEVNLKIYRYLLQNDTYAVTIGNVSFTFNGNNPANQSKHVPTVFWSNHTVTDKTEFKEIDRGQVTTNMSITIIRQLQVYADRLTEELQEAIKAIK